ncbi:MAG TPA: PilZ domain-containing protein [Treponemataceae bacterium]|nr:PilZ domain-containing protein [Treponemataceae bacterium]
MICNVSPIEKDFLLKTVFQNEQALRLHGVSTAGTGKITTIERSSMSITLLETIDNSCFSMFERITGYFDCHGNTYAFESIVRNTQDREINIDSPLKLLKSLQRKYVRVKKPRNIKVSFNLSNEEIQMDYPICPEYISIEDKTNNPDFAGKKIVEIIKYFHFQMEEKNSSSTIIMFRNKKPESFEEKLISNTGKVLFVPSTKSNLPKNDPYPEGRIITQEIEEQFEDPNHFIEGTHFSKLLSEKVEKGISSEIWCPIVYYQYVVGYIHSTKKGSDSFDISMVDYIWDFSRILAHQLKETGYFLKDSKAKQVVQHAADIIDMSPGGMLISLPSTDIRTPIQEGSVFSVSIQTKKNTVNCTARVARRFIESNRVVYGTLFLDLSPIDLMHLYETLYRKPFSDNDPTAYEQARKLVIDQFSK